MKNLIKLFILILMVSLLSCNIETIEGSRDIITKEFNLKDFDHIAVANYFDVTLVQSAEFKIKLECNKNIEEFATIIKRNKTLILNTESNKSYHNVTCKATVYMPNLISVKATGASKINISDFNTEKSKTKFNITLEGASKLIGTIVTNHINISVKGASLIKLAGAAKYGKITTAGATNIEAKDLIFKELNLNSSGVSKTVVHVLDKLIIELNGASKLDYFGKPQIVNQTINGAGKVSQLD